MNATATAVAELGQCPEARERAIIVGSWVWVTFQSKPSDETRAFLKTHGYRFNPSRGVWQNPCGVRTRGAPYDPRQKYGVIAVSAVSVLAEA
jgi:hypothetical protein